LAKKFFNNPSLVDEILSLDEQRKKLQTAFDETQAKVNSTSKEIGMLMAKGQKEDAEARKSEVATLKTSLEPISHQLATIEKQVHDALIQLPNLPSKQVPEGRTQ